MLLNGSFSFQFLSLLWFAYSSGFYSTGVIFVGAVGVIPIAADIGGSIEETVGTSTGTSPDKKPETKTAIQCSYDKQYYLV